MDTNRILADLRAERSRIDQAIAALEALDRSGTPTPARRSGTAQSAGRVQGRRRMSAAARQRLSAMMKERWEQRRKQAGQVPSAAASKPGGTRHLSAAARKRISEAAKRRWAEHRKAAKAAQ
jgi:hypothetical protein